MGLEFLEDDVGRDFKYWCQPVSWKTDLEAVNMGSQIYGTKNIVNAVLYSTPPRFSSLFSPKIAALEILTL